MLHLWTRSRPDLASAWSTCRCLKANLLEQSATGGGDMILVYITLNTMEEGQRVAHLLIERRLTNCVNFHPITCTYLWEGQITTEPEIVALVKTRAEHFDAVAAAVKEVVPYTNFVGQIEVSRVNEAFAAWLTDAVGVPTAARGDGQ
jgi:periplasmic divalent cation tolerance protein